MKFGRRAFLQFTAGAVGGTLLTPMPWKLADDSAIWSQNWRWRPSPDRGEVTKVKTICTLCESGCGIQARLVEKKRAILIEGNPAHPVNRGGICALGAAGCQFLYAPYRVSQPLKQTKKRGDLGGFQPISWEEAVKEIGAKLSRLRTNNQAASLACFTSNRSNSMNDLWSQFFRAYGSPNLFQMPSHQDSLALASALMTGAPMPPTFALARATYLLSFGAALLDDCNLFSRSQGAYSRWREQGSNKLVQIESRCSMTAAKADKWVAVAPGSEAAVALAIAHVLIKENAYDAAFMSGNVFGFEDWTDEAGKLRKGFKSFVLAEYAPEQVAQVAGVEAAKIREIAREFAIHKDALALWGSCSPSHPNNIYHDLAFMALNILKGNYGADGLMGIHTPPPLSAMPEPQLDASAMAGIQKQRLDQAQGRSTPLSGNAVYPFLDAVVQGGTYPIEMLWVHECNPAYTLLETQLFESALSKITTLVSFSSYMDETAQLADFILPNPVAFERYDDVIGLPGAPFAYYAVASPVLPPPAGNRHTGDVLIEMARHLGGTIQASLPGSDFQKFLKSRVEGLAQSGKGAVADNSKVDLDDLKPAQPVAPNFKSGDELWKKLVGGACWYDAPVDPSQKPGTPSGKIELACRSLVSLGLRDAEDKVFLPHYAPLLPPGSDKDFPLLLVPYEVQSLSHQYLANPPFLMKTLPDTLLKGNDLMVEVHPKTVQPMGLNEGDRVTLKTPQGELPVRVHLSAAARPGVVYAVLGLGHKAYDGYIKGKGVSVNGVTEVQLDPLTGLGTVWATRAQLVRA